MRQIKLKEVLSFDQLKQIVGGKIDSYICRCNISARVSTSSGYKDVAIELTTSENSQLSYCSNHLSCANACEAICNSHQDGSGACYKYLAQYDALGRGTNNQ